jgi:hypothetical protein
MGYEAFDRTVRFEYRLRAVGGFDGVNQDHAIPFARVHA